MGYLQNALRVTACRCFGTTWRSTPGLGARSRGWQSRCGSTGGSRRAPPLWPTLCWKTLPRVQGVWAAAGAFCCCAPPVLDKSLSRLQGAAVLATPMLWSCFHQAWGRCGTALGGRQGCQHQGVQTHELACAASGRSRDFTSANSYRSVNGSCSSACAGGRRAAPGPPEGPLAPRRQPVATVPRLPAAAGCREQEGRGAARGGTTGATASGAKLATAIGRLGKLAYGMSDHHTTRPGSCAYRSANRHKYCTHIMTHIMMLTE